MEVTASRPRIVVSADGSGVVSHAGSRLLADLADRSTPAVDSGGDPREHAAVAELTGLLPAAALGDYPEGTRIVVRRERPHPGAQLDLIETRDGWRYTCLATDTPAGQHALVPLLGTCLLFRLAKAAGRPALGRAYNKATLCSASTAVSAVK